MSFTWPATAAPFVEADMSEAVLRTAMGTPLLGVGELAERRT